MILQIHHTENVVFNSPSPYLPSSIILLMVVAMKSSAIAFPSRRFQLKWLFLLYIFIIYSATTPVLASSSTPISYSDHCASVVPEAIPTDLEQTTFQPFLELETSYYEGGERILGNNTPTFSHNYHGRSLSLMTTNNVYKTNQNGVYKIEAYLSFSSSHYLPDNLTNLGQSRFPRLQHSSFLLNGFWSDSLGKLCMVGSSSWYMEEGSFLNLQGVLKLNYARNTTISTYIASGILESVMSPNDMSYFDPFTIMAFPRATHYMDTLVTEEVVREYPGELGVPSSSLHSLQEEGVRQMLSRPLNAYKLEDANKCNPSKNCTPLGEELGYMPQQISVRALKCLNNGEKMQYLVEFLNSGYVEFYQPFRPQTTLVGEGSWDAKTNRLQIVACRILNHDDPSEKVHLGDCSTRLSLWYPGVWSIRKSFIIEGQMWTNKSEDESGYFDPITFHDSDENKIPVLNGMKYEYSEYDRVRRLYQANKHANMTGEKYPDGESAHMLFRSTVMDSTVEVANVEAFPIFVGEKLHSSQIPPLLPASEEEAWNLPEVNASHKGALNISYNIYFSPLHRNVGWTDRFSLLKNSEFTSDGQVKISAEGVYDDKTGQLCMVGCRNLDVYAQKSTNDSADCKILLNFQFPPCTRKTGGSMKGSIESMREKEDPLYFEPFNMSSSVYFVKDAEPSQRMNVIVPCGVVLFAAIIYLQQRFGGRFVLSQRFKKLDEHEELLPSVSKN